jgi:SAM-dependent methyltransferase
VKKEDLSRKEERFPLDLFFCQDCKHLQLLDVVDPLVLFRDYVYVSGTSPVFVKHFQDYVDTLSKRFGLGKGAHVTEIGSNDGTMLRMFQQKGMSVLGIDPAVEIARAATASGVKTLPELFSTSLAKKLSAESRSDLIVANNVFAHIDDLTDVVGGVRTLLKQSGAFVFEVSYLLDVVEKTLFDTIYHEHLCYHSVIALKTFFARNGMELFDAERVGSHGGSLRGYAQLTGGPNAVSPHVAELEALERQHGLDKAETFRRFAAKIEGLKVELSSLLKKLKAEGKQIAGYGAPAKATTLMHHFGLGPEFVDFIVDDSPLKQGLYSPGLHIPVLPAASIAERKPDYLLVLAWNFADSIIGKLKDYSAGGGKFIVPVPSVKVI